MGMMQYVGMQMFARCGVFWGCVLVEIVYICAMSNREVIIDKEELKRAVPLGPLLSGGFARMAMSVLRLNALNEVYAQCADRDGLDFLDAVLGRLGVEFEVSPDELARIPKQGPFISVSNHPFGGVDGVILLKLLLGSGRDEARVMGNFMLKRIKKLSPYVISVDPFEGRGRGNVAGLKAAITHLERGGCLGVFPAGEVSTYYDEANSEGVADREWALSMVRFIRRAQVPVVPIYFQGENSRLFHLLGLIHPLLRTAKLPSELLNKGGKPIRVRIGFPISVEEQNQRHDAEQLGRYLRMKTYMLGASLVDVNRFFRYRLRVEPEPEPIAEQAHYAELCAEVEQLRQRYLLFQSKNYSVMCAPSGQMPYLMPEIGRLRELTFRGVGEGTNRSSDLDEFDLYYWQLFIWDDDEQQLVGAYRVGKGREILARYGVRGFYTNTLFRFGRKFEPYLEQALELGRSIVVPDYQRRPLPLFLLWKGILYFLLKNPEYRYLIGPVSISNHFSNFSKGLIIDFMRSNYYDHRLARLVKPRNRFLVKVDQDQVSAVLGGSDDLNKLDRLIQEVEPEDYRMPVLLKKYVKLNGKLIGFNVDPKFNNALDGLLILDLLRVPFETITSLSKEINDKSILERFNASDYTFEDE